MFTDAAAKNHCKLLGQRLNFESSKYARKLVLPFLQVRKRGGSSVEAAAQNEYS